MMAAIIPMTPRFGASAAEWNHFDLVAELTEDLLPVVSNPGATISPNSKMQALGKTPSKYNGNGHAVGISDWTTYRATTADIESWSRQRDYGICLQTRRVRAIDVDIDDPQLAAQVRAVIYRHCILPLRMRKNSGKFLLAFDLPGEFFKRRMSVDGGIIEFLATGQQFVAVGTHPAGERYEWPEGLPAVFPTLTAAAFEQLWSTLERTFATEPSTTGTAAKKTEKLADTISSDPVAQHLLDRGLVLSIDRSGRHDISCPWSDEHTSESAESATSYWPAHTGGFEQGHFKCMHAHCEGRTDADFIEAIEYEMPAAIDEFVDISAPAPAVDVAVPAATPRSRFTPIQAAEFIKRPRPSWLIKQIIPQAELIVLFGASGSGKSFITIDLCMAIARGIEWRGHKVKQGPVYYVAAEGSGDVQLRIEAYAHHHEINLAEIPFYLIPAAPNMLLKADAVEVCREIGPGAGLVVLDTWAKVTAGGNENSGEDMGLALSHCAGIHRGTGAPILLVHHTGKDTDRGARGWSGLKAGVDAELEVCRVDDDRSLTVTKQKGGRDGLEFGFRLAVVPLGEDEDGEEVTSCAVEHTEHVVKATRFARKDSPLQAQVLSAVSQLVGIDNSPVDRSALLDFIVEHGDAEDKRLRDNATRAVKSLADKGRLLLQKSASGELVSLV